MRPRLLYTTVLLSFLTIVGSVASLAQKLDSGPQVLTFFSNADDTEQPYGLYIPKNYDPAKKYPLVMMLHGAGSNHRLDLRRVFGKSNAEGENDVEASKYFPQWDDVDYIVASPYARGTAGYQGIPEEDVYDVLADVKKRFTIDENRIYLTGLSMGGGGTLWIGLTRPDIWAAIAPVCPAPPAGTIDLASNALNFPVHFFHGDADPVVPVEGSRKWVSLLQDLGVEVFYKEFTDVKHDSWVNAYDNEYIFEWFAPAVRNPFPDQVNFVSKLYKYNKAFWVQFDQIKTDSLAHIEAKFSKANTLKVTTKNLEGFTLNLKEHPKFKLGTEFQINIDGTNLKSTADSSLSFSRSNGTWSVGQSKNVAVPQKRKGAEGPIYDAFSSRHVYVYGTADNPSQEELNKRIDLVNKAANWADYRGPFLGRMMFFPRVVADKDLRKSDLESSNLILFGTKETNLVIARHADKLPVHLNPASVDYGLFYVFPVDDHYLAVSSGLPWWTGTKDVGYPFLPIVHRKLSEFKDFLLFKTSSDKPMIDGHFSQSWQLSDEMKKMLLGSGAVTITK